MRAMNKTSAIIICQITTVLLNKCSKTLILQCNMLLNQDITMQYVKFSVCCFCEHSALKRAHVTKQPFGRKPRAQFYETELQTKQVKHIPAVDHRAQRLNFSWLVTVETFKSSLDGGPSSPVFSREVFSRFANCNNMALDLQ